MRTARAAGEKARRLHAGFETLERIRTTAHRNSAKPNGVVTSVVETGLLLILAAGVVWVVEGTLDVATLAAVFIIVARFSEPLSTFVMYTAILELIETALERIEDLLAITPLPVLESAPRPNRYDVRFDNVTFQYAQADELNAMISVVFQDVYLFDDTVLANIRMARRDASDAEVEAVARTAHCLEFIQRLPQGWHTRLGDIGANLSGSERQRISIARALLKDAPIVILDEPTAALDSENEVAVQRAIDTLVRNKTVIVIAHRLSTIVGADRILVFDDGCLVEQGQHDDLLARAGRYRALWVAAMARAVPRRHAPNRDPCHRAQSTSLSSDRDHRADRAAFRCSGTHPVLMGFENTNRSTVTEPL